MRLATMYLESEQLSTGQIAGILEMLGSHVESMRNAPNQQVTTRQSISPDTDVDEIVAKLRAAMTDERLALGLLAMYADPGAERAGMSLSGRLAWTYEAPAEGEPVRIVRFEKQLPRSVADRVMILGRDGFLECIGVERKELLWRTKLELPGRFDESTDAGTRGQSITRIGVVDGQTVVLNGPDGIFAVGALTGRLLWARPFDRAVMDLAGSAARERIMAAADGWVVAAPRDGYLTMMRIADGSTVWERDLRGEAPARVWMEGEAVVFDSVLLIADGEEVTLGAPLVEGAQVNARVVTQGRHRKLIVFKYHPKTHYRKMRGHRQPFTEVEVTSIVAQ
jgi:large subunit ribosomal protein L21